jgi:UDP-2,3-diacylglucosamine pyrophosphatase LpxH
MNVVIFSDLHLGSPLFNKRRDFVKLIKSPNYDTIILNGDVLDVWEMKLRKIVDSNSNIIDSINDIAKDKKVVFIKGNHDPEINDIRHLFPNAQVVQSYQMKDLFVIHGDEFDEFVNKYSYWAKLLFIPHWIGERFGLNLKAFFRELTHSISNKRKKKYYKELVRDINNEAIKKYKDRCKFLVMGHTHNPEIIKQEGCTYINGGDLIHNYTYVEFNTETNDFSLKRM